MSNDSMFKLNAVIDLFHHRKSLVLYGSFFLSRLTQSSHDDNWTLSSSLWFLLTWRLQQGGRDLKEGSLWCFLNRSGTLRRLCNGVDDTLVSVAFKCAPAAFPCVPLNEWMRRFLWPFFFCRLVSLICLLLWFNIISLSSSFVLPFPFISLSHSSWPGSFTTIK